MPNAGIPTFGMTPGNNAPLPMFGSMTNPSGFGGIGVGGSSTGFPNFPMFGTPSSSPTSPLANAPAFSMGGTPYTDPSMGSGFTNLPGGNQYFSNIYNQAGKAYGQGTGQLIGDILTQGLFNPQVAQSYINFMQPQVNRGEANLLNSFGAEGSRFSSSAQYGLGDYLSQVNLNEGNIFAGMYTQAQQEQMSLLENILPTLHGERSNSSGILDDILGGLEVAGGIAAIPFSGGMSTGLIAGGLGTLATGINGGGGGNTNTGTAGFNPLIMGSTFNPWMNSGTFGNNAPAVGSEQWVNNWMANEQQQSAGVALGGASSNNPDPFMMLP